MSIKSIKIKKFSLCSGILSPNKFWEIISKISYQLDFRHLTMHLTTLNQRCQSGFSAPVWLDEGLPPLNVGQADSGSTLQTGNPEH